MENERINPRQEGKGFRVGCEGAGPEQNTSLS